MTLDTDARLHFTWMLLIYQNVRQPLFPATFYLAVIRTETETLPCLGFGAEAVARKKATRHPRFLLFHWSLNPGASMTGRHYTTELHPLPPTPAPLLHCLLPFLSVGLCGIW